MARSGVAAGPLVGIIAGEPSGDLLGSALVAALRSRRPDLRFVGIGGPKMMAAGVESLFPMEKLSVRGYVEVLRHYREIIGIRRDLKKFFLRERPSVFIGVDAPDFNLDLEMALKADGIPTVHYVSPSIWAWRGGRIRRSG
jgi:lipid-A-disaccharide synthase